MVVIASLGFPRGVWPTYVATPCGWRGLPCRLRFGHAGEILYVRHVYFLAGHQASGPDVGRSIFGPQIGPLAGLRPAAGPILRLSRLESGPEARFSGSAAHRSVRNNRCRNHVNHRAWGHGRHQNMQICRVAENPMNSYGFGDDCFGRGIKNMVEKTLHLNLCCF